MTVDLRVLPRGDRPGIDVVARYIERIRQLRGDGSPAITLRRDDLQKLAGLLGVSVGQLLAGLDGQGPPDGGEHPTLSRSEPHVVIDLDICTDQTSASEGRR